MVKDTGSAPLRTISAAPDNRRAGELLGEIVSQPAQCGPRRVDKPLVLYGAGDLGRMAKAYFDRLGIPVACVVDANAKQYDGHPSWRDVRVVPPDEVTSGDREGSLLAVCIVKVPFSELHASLSARGWRDVVPFYDVAEAYRDQHPLGNGWFAGQIADEEVAGIKRVLPTWADDLSRAHHLQFVAWHRLRDDWFFAGAPVTTEDRYFIPEVLEVLHDCERFLDVGAHCGEVIPRFVAAVSGRYESISAIEPDEGNFAALSSALNAQDATTQISRCIKAALGDSEGKAKFFNGLGYASQFSEIGQEYLEVTTLDRLNLDPTFLKLHLEGWELGALKGATRTLGTYRPIIAATAYHNRLGLFQLAEWLMSHLPRYRFFLRLHSWCGTGLVIYAIPNERYSSESSR